MMVLQVMNGTERPMNANSLPWPGEGRPLPARYSGVAQAAFTAQFGGAKPWAGSIGRGFCVVEIPTESAAADTSLTGQSPPGDGAGPKAAPTGSGSGSGCGNEGVWRVSATSEASPQVVHRQSLEFDVPRRVVSAAQEVTRCVSRFSSVPTCAWERAFTFDRLALLPGAGAGAGAGQSDPVRAPTENGLVLLSASLAPAARHFASEGRGGCLLCCGTARSGKENLLDLGMHRSGSSLEPAGLASGFLGEVFAALPRASPGRASSPGGSSQAPGVRIGLLCSTNGQLTDAASEAFLQGEILETSAGIQQVMLAACCLLLASSTRSQLANMLLIRNLLLAGDGRGCGHRCCDGGVRGCGVSRGAAPGRCWDSAEGRQEE